MSQKFHDTSSIASALIFNTVKRGKFLLHAVIRVTAAMVDGYAAVRGHCSLACAIQFTESISHLVLSPGLYLRGLETDCGYDMPLRAGYTVRLQDFSSLIPFTTLSQEPIVKIRPN